MGNFPSRDELIDLREYKRETYEQVLKRYYGFGNELYTLIQQRLPDVFTHLTYYRSKVSHPDNDSYAIYKHGDVSFAIQLAYYDAICLWNEKGTREIKDWNQDYYEDALKHIAELAGAELR